MKRTVNEIVQQCRWDSDLTMAEVSQATGLSAPYICQIENCLRRCPEYYWMFWALQGKLKAEDYKQYPNLPEGYGCAKI